MRNDTYSAFCLARKNILTQLEEVCSNCKRKLTDVNLIAVSKKQSIERIDAALAAGHRVFGENQMAEAVRHWQGKNLQYPDLQLHFIGHLQSNKAAEAVRLFDVIETLDSIKLARALDREMQKSGRRPDVLVQINTGEEPQKYGIKPVELTGFLKRLREETNIKPTGLMCLPPKADEPGLHFALLAKLAHEHELQQLSMGMSEDYKTAIRFGATHIRLGSKLFGSRLE